LKKNYKILIKLKVCFEKFIRPTDQKIILEYTSKPPEPKEVGFGIEFLQIKTFNFFLYIA
jgi:hypothetical protein